VFVEDTVVVYGDLAVIARSGAVERRPEAEGTEKAVAQQDFPLDRFDNPQVRANVWHVTSGNIVNWLAVGPGKELLGAVNCFVLADNGAICQMVAGGLCRYVPRGSPTITQACC